MSNQRESPLCIRAGVELLLPMVGARGVLAGWASTPRLGAFQTRRCCALFHAPHPRAPKTSVIQGRLADDAPVFANPSAGVVDGLGSGLGAGVLGSGLGAGALGSGLGVDAGGSGVTLGVGAGVLGSGVGAGGVGGAHCLMEGSHSMQPFPSHVSASIEEAACDVSPKRDSVQISPMIVASRATLSGVLFLGSAVVMFPLSLVGIADCKSSLSSHAGK